MPRVELLEVVLVEVVVIEVVLSSTSRIPTRRVRTMHIVAFPESRFSLKLLRHLEQVAMDLVISLILRGDIAIAVGLPIIGWRTVMPIDAASAWRPFEGVFITMLLSVLPSTLLVLEADVIASLVVEVVVVAEDAAPAATEGYGWRLKRVLWTQALPIVLWILWLLPIAVIHWSPWRIPRCSSAKETSESRI